MKIYFVVLLSFLTVSVIGQISAITENGDEVSLYLDGTWQYKNDSLTESIEIPVNPNEFVKSKKSSFLLKSKKFNIGIWIDPKKWKVEKNKDNEDAEYELELKNEDLYALLITEKVVIPIDVLKDIALKNASEVTSDLKIIHQEYRTVNGLELLYMQMDGNISGLKFSYCGYYYSNENGTVQFLTYTAQNLVDDYKEQIEEMLNGFVETD